ncbi:MAG: DUF2244 domain-containing protein [Alphaproteobacteria bacterium]|jgi:uncharacterized membrane protein|nr:DUF2244 domain-containing protein [Alphaproteobacteria bacterium]MDP6567831.1 DUF2244 domain-containing protein [Alphaproteobacteria bacterium]MDP6813355.1 DUF2244 domain-containing protein [Alphaproteobacteria bacterium]
MGKVRPTGDKGLLFDAVLRPHRSLSPTGFRILMTVVCLGSLAIGLAFLLHGAWPVFGFLGLDVAAIYLAFRLSYRAGRLAETVQLSPGELLIRRIQPNGRQRSWRFQPYWARVKLEAGAFGEGSVLVSSHGRSVRLARFLAPEERIDFANALGLALRRLSA